MTEEIPEMVDLRNLGQREVEELEELAAKALFHPDPLAREDAISGLHASLPHLIGAYARNRIILYMREPETGEFYQAYLCDLKNPWRQLRSHPFFDADGEMRDHNG